MPASTAPGQDALGDAARTVPGADIEAPAHRAVAGEAELAAVVAAPWNTTPQTVFGKAGLATRFITTWATAAWPRAAFAAGLEIDRLGQAIELAGVVQRRAVAAGGAAALEPRRARPGPGRDRVAGGQGVVRRASIERGRVQPIHFALQHGFRADRRRRASRFARPGRGPRRPQFMPPTRKIAPRPRPMLEPTKAALNSARRSARACVPNVKTETS